MEADNYPKTKLLIVDDDQKLCRLVRDYLAPLGYEVESAHTGPEGLEKARTGDYQAVILDCMLPGMDGFEVLRQLRRDSTVPVLMLTALGDEADRIVGLEIGADDYLPKTFSTRELLARLRAVTRRAQITSQQAALEAEELSIQELSVNLAARRAAIRGQTLVLTPVEFDLLACLARAADRVLSRDHLLDEISGRDYEVFDRSIDVHISSLRRKLGDDPKNPSYIKTVRSAGYMLLRTAEE
ncbi:MAG: response regulator transcription factor [Acidobacteria bacterium]|nr:response regulator transcription factor [Acidobacteriota bacterium]MBI3424253.1 response regulator transcription factor [Acidobacteriota bacterium]